VLLGDGRGESERVLFAEMRAVTVESGRRRCQALVRMKTWGVPGRWAVAVVAAVGVGVTIVGSATSHGVASFAAPGATLDQSNPARPPACMGTGWAPDSANEWTAQTFTAGISGSLTDVVLWLSVSNPSIPVAIVPADGTGPVVSTPLAQATLAGVNLAPYAPIDISFTAPARVEAGKQYAIVLYAPARSAWAWQGDVGSSYSDEDGKPCADGAYGAGRWWLSSIASFGADADFFFQTYVIPSRRLAVEKNGTGTGSVRDDSQRIDCGPSCSAEVRDGQTITLSALPDAGSIFAGWSGGTCAGSAPSCSLSVQGDATVAATFTKNLVTLSVSKVGRGVVKSQPRGITCGLGCTHVFVPGQVKLIAKPVRGWRFSGWRGACRGSKPSCQIDLTRTSRATATFTRR